MHTSPLALLKTLFVLEQLLHALARLVDIIFREEGWIDRGVWGERKEGGRDLFVDNSDNSRNPKLYMDILIIIYVDNYVDMEG